MGNNASTLGSQPRVLRPQEHPVNRLCIDDLLGLPPNGPGTFGVNSVPRFPGGVVELFFTALGEEAIVLSSRSLAKRSPWFKTELLGAEDNRDEIEYERFEIIYRQDGSWELERRSNEISSEDRIKVEGSALRHMREIARPIYDNDKLDEEVRDASKDRHRDSIIDAHRVGFALLLDISVEQSELKHRIAEYIVGCTNPTLVILQLLEFADYYASVDTLAHKIDSVVMDPEYGVGRRHIKKHPVTYLRISCVVRSYRMFREALLQAADLWLSEPLNELEQEPQLKRIVVNAAAHRFSLASEMYDDAIVRVAEEETYEDAVPLWRWWLAKELRKHGRGGVLHVLANKAFCASTLTADFIKEAPGAESDFSVGTERFQCLYRAVDSLFGKLMATAATATCPRRASMLFRGSGYLEVVDSGIRYVGTDLGPVEYPWEGSKVDGEGDVDLGDEAGLDLGMEDDELETEHGGLDAEYQQETESEDGADLTSLTRMYNRVMQLE